MYKLETHFCELHACKNLERHNMLVSVDSRIAVCIYIKIPSPPSTELHGTESVVTGGKEQGKEVTDIMFSLDQAFIY